MLEYMASSPISYLGRQCPRKSDPPCSSTDTREEDISVIQKRNKTKIPSRRCSDERDIMVPLNPKLFMSSGTEVGKKEGKNPGEIKIQAKFHQLSYT